MMCDKCGKNPATTHVKTVINGVIQQNHLCSYCAAKGGYNSFGNLSLANLLTSMFSDSAISSHSVSRRCECCGSSFSDIVESGRVGCSECYEIFKAELLPSLNRLHGKALHVGATPVKKTPPVETLEQKIAKLKEDMLKAIDNEDFEKAAELRDEIKALKGEGSNNE